ncbi:MAG: EF-P lysine aminoacylase EpmA [bacterium]|nr:EF-P lysine aminoacylase EpmA [bacterium]
MSWRRLKDLKLQRRLKVRSRIIQLIREFFLNQGFFEAETPILTPTAGQEPYLNPLKINFQDEQGKSYDAYLITSPEYNHKRLLAAGFAKTFEITRSFRGGEPWSGQHNPEFTILEWYRARADYRKIMRDVEKMVCYIATKIFPERKPLKAAEVEGPSTGSGSKLLVKYLGRTIDLTPPWERLSMHEAWEKYAGIDRRARIDDRQYVRGLCKARGYTVNKNDSYDDLFFKIFLTEIEPHLGQGRPIILFDYPASMAALARLKSSIKFPSLDGRGKGRVKQRYAERFEVYVAGMELGNAFSELNDAREQRQRFLTEQGLRRKLGKESIPLDEDFLDALKHMPPAAGIAFGIDRLVMLLTNAKTIDDVLAFPADDLFGV